MKILNVEDKNYVPPVVEKKEPTRLIVKTNQPSPFNQTKKDEN